MDQRFTRAWEELEEARKASGSLAHAVRKAPTRVLIGALAGVGERDPVAANVLATELLNRETRAPFSGAFLVSLTIFMAIFLLDLLYTGTPFVLESGARGYVLASLTAVTASVSLFLFLVWRGRVRPPRLVRRKSPRGY